MRTIIFTSNALRHRFVANSLTEGESDSLVIVETKSSDGLDEVSLGRPLTTIEQHFRARYETERRFFADHEVLRAPSIPIRYGEVNFDSTFAAIREFQPGAAFVFGAGIIKPPLITEIPEGRFINLHLGLSPYYRGSGTNFWPFVNQELEYVGATIHHLDPGIDTGGIVSHAVPDIESGDDIHSIGCKVIVSAVDVLREVRERLAGGSDVPSTEQWEVENARYYRTADFDEEALARYHTAMDGGLVDRYLSDRPPAPRLISLGLAD